MANTLKILRCAIYTRKSSEEGLEQEFNSLDAQREACEAYIKSQKHEGWQALPDTYDDGGYSGGTLQRPALDDLLTHIKQKKIDVVVVYKIDRLTRSLMDFSKIVEIFDAGGVSFVSVTQQFNTTTSMGRLTLNVLLSFAQFEREVTGERIRDKIAASKKKGMWMGGHVPFGYGALKRELLIKELEAQMVCQIYELYLELGTVKAVKCRIDEQHITADQQPDAVGKSFSRGHLYRILTNPIYMGKISHKGVLSDGLHDAVIPAQQWHAVQSKLKDGAARERDHPSATEQSPLASILFDHNDKRITPSHAVKAGKRYRYYISNCLIENPTTASGARISAPEVESAVCVIIHDLLADEQRLSGLAPLSGLNASELKAFFATADKFAAQLHRQASYAQLMKLRSAIARIVIGLEDIKLTLDVNKFVCLITNKPIETAAVLSDRSNTQHEVKVPMRVGRRGQETRLILQSVKHQQRPIDGALLTLIAKGYA
jgi:site-specific DNA recombinase